jgi:hypothetical protein
MCLFMEQGFIEKLMTGVFLCQTHSIICNLLFGERLSEGLIVLFALWWLIPLIMSFLTQVLKHSANRWINLVLGIFFALLAVDGIISHLLMRWLPFSHLLFLISMFLVPILIAWYAWKLPKEETRSDSTG